MRFLADEHVSRRVIDALRAAGHDVVAASVVCAGAPDTTIVETAHLEQRIVITEDTGFGELVIRQSLRVPGLILIELPGLTSDEIAARVSHVVAQHGEMLVNALVVVEPSRTRRREL